MKILRTFIMLDAGLIGLMASSLAGVRSTLLDGGSDSRPPTNHATLQFTNMAAMFKPLRGYVLPYTLIVVGTGYLAATYGGTVALAAFLGLNAWAAGYLEMRAGGALGVTPVTVQSGPTAPAQADPALLMTKAFPAAGAANATTALDLAVTGSLYPTNERLALQVSLPATPSLVDAKTIILTVKDSPDNVTFTAIPELGTITVTGAGGVGAAATSKTFPLPGTTKRYLRVDAAVLAAGGDNTALSYTGQLLVRV